MEELSSTPSTPASGKKKLYPKTDGKLYTLNSAGTEVEVGAGGSGGSGGIAKWVSATSYAVDDVMWYDTDKKIYVCNTANSDVTFTEAKWDALSVETVPTITSFQSYTPSTQGNFTPSELDFYWRRVGDVLEVEGTFRVASNGSSGGDDVGFSLPSSLEVSDDYSTAIWHAAGEMHIMRTEGKIYFPLTRADASHKNWFRLGVFDYSGAVNVLNPIKGGSMYGDWKYDFKAKVRIKGW